MKKIGAGEGKVIGKIVDLKEEDKKKKLEENKKEVKEEKK